MSDWSMTVEAGASLGGLSSSGAGSAGPAGMVATVRRAGRAEPEPLGPVAVEGPATPDSLADALAALAALGGGEGEPARLTIVTDPDAEGRIFDELDEAAALAGLPAPTWLPAPVALAGAPLAERLEPGDLAVVLDTRDGDLTAWPVERTPRGIRVGEAGPVAVAERLDELITGVVRATGAAREGADPEAATGPIDTGVDTAPVTVGEGAIRRESARLRREVRRVRRSLAEDEVEEVTVASGSVGGVVDRALFTQLVTVALSESMITLVGDAGVAIELVAAGPTPLARALAELTGAVAETVRGPHAAVLGAAALLGPVGSGRTAAAVTDDSPTDDLPRGALAAAVAGAGSAGAGGSPTAAAATPTPEPATTDDAAALHEPASSTPAEAGSAEAPSAPAAAPAPAAARRDGTETADDAPAPASGPATEPADGPGAEPEVTPAPVATPSTAVTSTDTDAEPSDRPDTASPSEPDEPAPSPASDPSPESTTSPGPVASSEPAVTTASAPSSEPTAPSTAVATSTDATASQLTPPAAAGEPEPQRSARPRWAVPALAVSLVVAIVGALGVILLGPDSTTGRTGAAPAPLVVQLAGPTTGLPAGVAGPPALSR